MATTSRSVMTAAWAYRVMLKNEQAYVTASHRSLRDTTAQKRQLRTGVASCISPAKQQTDHDISVG